MATEKVAVTIEAGLLAETEKLRRKTRESRSALFNRALRKLVLSEERARRVRRYVEAYRQMPETDEEIQRADRLARESLRQAPPWDAR